MSSEQWSSRAEWQAAAEYSVRTFCTPLERLERLERGVIWSTLAEDVELEERALFVAKALRPLLAAEICRLRAGFPDRPSKASARGPWLVGLDDERYEAACNLAGVEGIRRETARAIRDQQWADVAWQTGRIRRHYPDITLAAPLLASLDRMEAIRDAATARRDAAADEAVEAAVVAAVAHRATDEGWAQELQRRERIDEARSGRTVHRAAVL